MARQYAGARGNHRRRIVLAGLVSFAVAVPAVAERLPIRTYTTDDGLPHQTILRIVSDSRGFVWLGTLEGLARFDGERFTSWGRSDGLPGDEVYDLLEARDGTYWVATYGGICRFDPEAPTMTCEPIPLPDQPNAHLVRRLFQDRSGQIWAGTVRGLYRFERRGDAWEAEPVELAVQAKWAAESLQVNDLHEDDRGRLWIATRGTGIDILAPDGRIEYFDEGEGHPIHNVRVLGTDRHGRIWSGSREGLCLLVEEPRAGEPLAETCYGKDGGLPASPVWDIQTGDDGTMWVATEGGLVRVVEALPGVRSIQAYGLRQGLSDTWLLAAGFDRDGNLWLSARAGAMRLAREGFTSYGGEDGLPDPKIAALLTDREGRVLLVSEIAMGKMMLHRFDGSRFTADPLPTGGKRNSWGCCQLVQQDPSGEWWIATAEGLVELEAVPAERISGARIVKVWTTADGLADNEIYRVFTDSRGWIWTSQGWLERTSGGVTVRRYDDEVGRRVGWPQAFAEDRSGGVWIGAASGLARFHDGSFRFFGSGDGLPALDIGILLIDREGRLWAADHGRGLIRIDDPAGDEPRFTWFGTAEGLSSHNVNTLTEDSRGRIYLGTGRGVDRLDPATGTFRHYSLAHGLIGTEQLAAARDAAGDLWFATRRGVSRLSPGPDLPVAPPPVFISGVTLAGKPLPLPLLGAAKVDGLSVGPGDRQIEIEFFGLGFRPGEPLSYQYRLMGSSAAWSPPRPERFINFARLAPGSYRFELRAVHPRGATSESPAVVSFVVLRPIWQRWWFVALAGLGLIAAAAAWHRARVARLLDAERLRMRLAMDLHDEVGSGLGSIGLMAEVAATQQVSDERRRGLADQIGEIARELGASLSDIVWSLRPGSDTLEALAARLVERAGQLVPLDRMSLKLAFPARWPHVRLTLPVSRNVLLIGVEALHNAAKHSGGSQVTLELAAEGRLWRLRICDDGPGCSGGLPPAGADGLGLASMRRRADEIGASLSLESAAGSGVAVTLVFEPEAPGGRGAGRRGPTSASYDRATGRAGSPAA